jgi:hypothetical protein
MEWMDWARRLLTDSGDDSRFRAGLGVILATCLAVIPLLSGRMDTRTFLTVALLGSIVVLPFWRRVGEPLNRSGSIVAFLGILIGPLAVGRMFSGLAILTYLGAWTFTLAVMRLLTGWRDPIERAPDLELNPNGLSWSLVLVLVLPLLAIAGLAIWVIATDRGRLW